MGDINVMAEVENMGEIYARMADRNSDGTLSAKEQVDVLKTILSLSKDAGLTAEQADALSMAGEMGQVLCKHDSGKAIIDNAVSGSSGINEVLANPSDIDNFMATAKEKINYDMLKENGLDLSEADLDGIGLYLKSLTTGAARALPGGLQKVTSDDVCHSGLLNEMAKTSHVR